MERSFSRVLFVPLIAAIGIFLIVHFNVFSFFLDRERLSELLTSYGPLSVVIFISLQMVQVIVSPLPGDVTGLLGGYLYGAFLGTVYSTIGLSVGSWIAFLLARSLGLPFVEKIIRPATIRKYDHFLEHQGRVITFIFFLIPGFPKDTLCYILGLSHMRTRDFLVISTAGRLLGTIILSIQGSSLREDHDVIFFILLGVTVLIILWGYFHIGRWLKSVLRTKREESRPALSPPPDRSEGVPKPPDNGSEGKQR
ncbi:MAG TPA: TVP38/TMEM64 family protein [Syntrophales bacterium]|nr:TVP38/TMEM64 family protein [Syntrophales bacterium]